MPDRGARRPLDAHGLEKHLRVVARGQALLLQRATLAKTAASSGKPRDLHPADPFHERRLYVVQTHYDVVIRRILRNDNDDIALDTILQVGNLGNDLEGLKERYETCGKGYGNIAGPRRRRFLNRDIHAEPRLHRGDLHARHRARRRRRDSQVQDNIHTGALCLIRVRIVFHAGVLKESDDILDVGLPEINFRDLDGLHLLYHLKHPYFVIGFAGGPLRFRLLHRGVLIRVIPGIPGAAHLRDHPLAGRLKLHICEIELALHDFPPHPHGFRVERVELQHTFDHIVCSIELAGRKILAPFEEYPAYVAPLFLVLLLFPPRPVPQRDQGGGLLEGLNVGQQNRRHGMAFHAGPAGQLLRRLQIAVLRKEHGALVRALHVALLRQLEQMPLLGAIAHPLERLNGLPEETHRINELAGLQRLLGLYKRLLRVLLIGLPQQGFLALGEEDRRLS